MRKSGNFKGYRVSGRTGDGVRILTPIRPPSHFTTREIRNTISKVIERSGLDGLFGEPSDGERALAGAALANRKTRRK